MVTETQKNVCTELPTNLLSDSSVAPADAFFAAAFVFGLNALYVDLDCDLLF